MDEFTTPPTQPTPTATGTAEMAHRTHTATLARIGLVGIAAAALLAVALLAFGSTMTPASTLAATGSTSSTPNIVLDLNGAGGAGLGRGIGGGITITAISGFKLTLATADGWTRTITVDSGTTYSKSGATITLADLKVGDEIGFRQTHETDGSWTIDSIAIVAPRAGGEITAISGSTITVTQRDGTTATIKVTGSTTYTVNGNGAALADVKVGMYVVADGTKNSDGSLTATNLHAGDQGSLRGPGDGFGGGHGFGR